MSIKNYTEFPGTFEWAQDAEEAIRATIPGYLNTVRETVDVTDSGLVPETEDPIFDGLTPVRELEEQPDTLYYLVHVTYYWGESKNLVLGFEESREANDAE